MKTIIYQQVFLRDAAQARLFGVSHALIRRLNPDAHTLVIDNGSEIDPWEYAQPDLYFRFPERIGHFFHDFHGMPDGSVPRDGPGRAHCMAMQIAMEAGYDRAVYIEADALFAKPVEWGFAQMTTPVACQPACMYYKLDWHVVWFRDLKWLKTFDFPGRYDWQNRTGEPGGEPAGEVIWHQILGDNVASLPVRGTRGESISLDENNYWMFYPDGCDLVTHVSTATCAHFLKMNGHPDLADRL